MEQVRAINALEPFILLSNSASSPRRAAELVSQAISAPSTYVFAELLQTPNIQALRDSPEYSPHLRLLEIFAWGTIADYQSEPTTHLTVDSQLTSAAPDSPTPLPPLTAAQREKLQLLSLLSAAATASTGSPIPYATLQPALAPTDGVDAATPAAAARALERAVAGAALAGLLDARLDPRRARRARGRRRARRCATCRPARCPAPPARSRRGRAGATARSPRWRGARTRCGRGRGAGAEGRAREGLL